MVRPGSAKPPSAGSIPAPASLSQREGVANESQAERQIFRTIIRTHSPAFASVCQCVRRPQARWTAAFFMSECPSRVLRALARHVISRLPSAHKARYTAPRGFRPRHCFVHRPLGKVRRCGACELRVLSHPALPDHRRPAAGRHPGPATRKTPASSSAASPSAIPTAPRARAALISASPAASSSKRSRASRNAPPRKKPGCSPTPRARRRRRRPRSGRNMEAFRRASAERAARLPGRQVS